jgi:pre-rRNA-processing protein IPI3
MPGGEVVLTAFSPGGAEGVFGCVCDIHSGTIERTFKGEPTVKAGHGRVGSDLVVACHATKPVINFWTWSKGQVLSRLSCPGQVSALQCSHDGVYCVIAVSEKLYMWQLPTGNLLAVLCGHYQNVRVLKFMDDDSLFLSGGDDSLVLVWQTARVVSSSTCGWNPHPLHAWSKHSLPVTDIHCGFGGVRGHVFTSSLDRTCKIWEVSSGQLLSSIVFDLGITAVTTDAAEFRLFAGSLSGTVQQVNLYERVLSPNVGMAISRPLVFHGHSQQISSLALSLDGSLLVSGSCDATVRVWHVSSQQCIRIFKQKG